MPGAEAIHTIKLNGVDPQAWLADVPARPPDHAARWIADLLPWNRDAATRSRQAAPGGITAGGRRA
jgi:transposase